MKLVFCLLAILVVVSHQQHNERSGYKFPWYMPFQHTTDYGDLFSARNRFDEYPLYRLNPFPTFNFVQNEEGNFGYVPQIIDNESPPQSIQGRVKGFKIIPANGKQQQRFFLGGINGGVNSNAIGNPLLKTATLTITSTCTALSVINCIPSTNINAGVAPFTACARRRRNYILPTQVQIIMPTVKASLHSMRQERQIPTQVVSSKSDDDEPELDRDISRAKRFFGPLWQQFATGLTTTSWSVLSVTSTKTYIPNNAAGPVLDLVCIPPGYVLC